MGKPVNLASSVEFLSLFATIEKVKLKFVLGRRRRSQECDRSARRPGKVTGLDPGGEFKSGAGVGVAPVRTHPTVGFQGARGGGP